MKKKDTIIFFNFSLKIFFSIIFDRSKDYIYFEKENKIIHILKFINNDLKNLDFETSKVFINGRNIHYIAEEKANKICKQVLQKYIKKNKIIVSLNAKYKKNTINDYLQKKIFDEIKTVILKILISNYLISQQKIIKLETEYSSIYKNFIEKNTKHKIEFINKINLFLLLKIIFYFFKILFFKKDFKLIKKKNMNILSVQEEIVFENFKLRSQPHWINKYERDLRLNIIQLAPISTNELKNLKIINFFKFKSFLLSIKNDRFCVNLIKDIKIIIRKYKDYNYLNIKLVILDLLTTTIFLKSITNSNQIKMYLYQESNIISSSANIISASNYLKTIQFQYSHLQTINPVIKSNADYYLSFSNKYKSIFSDLDIKPNKIIQTGCLRENYLNFLKVKNRKLSNTLKNKFKICFFDESFEDRWGLISRIELRQIYKKIFIFLKKNKSFVLITKSQFKKASLNNLFKNDEIYKKLIDEKRIINLKEDLDINDDHLHNRNTILTLEAAQLSDICISFKYGATAGLESAFIGKRVILFDFNNFKSPFDKIYNKSEICFKNFDKLLNRINIYKVNFDKNKKDNLGNWNKIIKIFTKNNYMKEGFGTKNYFRNQIININNEINKINNIR